MIQPNPEHGCLAHKTILYVEDDDDVREQLSQFFQRRCGKLIVAADGAAGLKAFHEHRPDLVITDILMPVMDGLVMAQKIRAVDAKIPIIVTTAFEQIDFMMRAIELGIDKYVIKPVKMDLLLAAVQDCARRMQLEEQSKLAALVYENSSESMLITEVDGRIISANPAFTRLTGYALEEVTGHMPDFLKSGRHDEAFFQGIWHALNTTGKWQGEIWNRRKDGEIYAQWLSIDTIFNQDGAPYRRVGLFFDITLIKALESAGKLAHPREPVPQKVQDNAAEQSLRAELDAAEAFEFANLDHPVMQELQRLCIERQLRKLG